MKEYKRPTMEIVLYNENDILLKSGDTYQKNGIYNAEGSGSGWTKESII
ncbi:MAG: hypothetical protein IIU14_01505 [Ruminococcus sp.]|nr:hypothetical protein [Ruminococcus sp.]